MSMMRTFSDLSPASQSCKNSTRQVNLTPFVTGYYRGIPLNFFDILRQNNLILYKLGDIWLLKPRRIDILWEVPSPDKDSSWLAQVFRFPWNFLDVRNNALITTRQPSWGRKVFSRGCLSTGGGGSKVTITYDALDLTVQGPWPLCRVPSSILLVTSGGQDWRPVQTCPLEDITVQPPVLLTSGG